MARRVRIRDVFNLLAIAGLSFVVFLWLMPNVKMGRTESRTWMAYRKVRLLHDEFQSEAPMEPGTLRELSEKDPWDRPYVVKSFLENGEARLRVISQGPSPETEEDDIYSDMPTSPLQPFKERRDRESIQALLSSGLLWLGLSILYYKQHMASPRETSN